jgi:hypothetical protein
VDTFSGDQPDDNTENRKENQLLEVATAYVVDVAGNILPRQALNPIFAAEDDIMFHIIDGQWGTVLVKAAMPARDNTPGPTPVAQNSKTTTSRARAVPVDGKRPTLPEESNKMFHIVGGQWGTVLVKDVMPARDNTPAPAVRKVTMTYNRSPFGCMQMIDGQYASIQPETAGTKFV